MRNLLSCIIILTSIIITQAQTNLNSYSGLLSEGTIPDVFHNTFTLSDKDEDVLLLKNLFQSGQVLYGTALNQYLDNIMDNLLANDPQLRKQITVFVVRSSGVNASATRQGYIFVNVGLLAQATNEAEIAFILAHEIVHIADKHDAIKLEKNKNLNYYLSYHNRSREQENEADRYALQRYFASSNYSYKAIDGAFDILQYGYLPFDNLPFKRSFVETDFYTFDDKYYLENIKPVRSREDYIDTLSTHPNILKRRTAAKNIYETKNDEGRLTFVQSQELFNQMQTLARFECIHQYLINHNYGQAYYNAYVLAQTMPENTYLQNAMAIAIYGLSKHKQQGSLREILPRHANIEGEIQQIHFFFGEISRPELNVLAIRSLWKAYKNDPNNKLLLSMCENAIKDMTGKNKLNLNDFSDYPAGTEIIEETVATVDTVSNAAQNKYDRIKKAPITKVKPSERFKTVNYMLVDIKNDEDFVRLVQETKDKMEDENVMNIIRSENKEGIGNNGMLLLEPYYQFVRDYETVHGKTTTGRKKLTKAVKTSVKKLNINGTFIEKDQFATYTTTQYNQYCRIMDWLDDVYSIENDMIFYQNEEIRQVATELDCKYITLTGVTISSGKFLSFNKFQDLTFSILCPIVAPAYLSKFFLARRKSKITFMVIEIETGKVFFSRQNTIGNATSQTALVNAYIYNYLYQVKKGEKK
ncbi:MAG: M48 family metallopeptidase [Bacteroidales bacterium]|nr:M48 family metallopeptidase [Bacteroidales bacterium]